MDLTKVTQQIPSQQDDLLELVKQLVAFETPAPPAQKSINWTIFIQLIRQHLRYDCYYKN
ncbi:hypothetical protein [Leuconostoc mesenteroides]|uniref:hypothetical protein n=1 Tax=Leuconostoc mesenteroides TaxID=1245 RepID=UPI0030CDA8EF